MASRMSPRRWGWVSRESWVGAERERETVETRRSRFGVWRRDPPRS